jgi:hypothetical protein
MPSLSKTKRPCSPPSPWAAKPTTSNPHQTKLVSDSRVQLFVVIEIVGKRSVNLAQARVWMLPTNLGRIPVGNPIERNLDALCPGARNIRDPLGGHLDVRMSRSRHSGFGAVSDSA